MLNLLVIAFGLAMDSFSASLVLGGNTTKSKLISIGVLISGIFGLFHIGMLSLGFLIGEAFESFISGIDHWIAFFLLIAVGLRMIVSRSRDGKRFVSGKQIDTKLVLSLSLATSIDALILGMGIAFMGISIPVAVMIIGLVVFLLSLVGFSLGQKGNKLLHDKAGIVGGVVLIIMGIKILLEHGIL